MPTRTHSSDPFAPRGSLSQAQLLAYAQGKLSPAEAHEVELHLEQDPLLREAAEGLKQSGAIAGAQELARIRPSGGGNVALWFGTAAVGIIVVALTGWYASQAPLHENLPSGDPIPTVDAKSLPPLEHAEIAAANEQPESLRIGHEPTALHHRANAMAVVRENWVERMVPRQTDLDTIASVLDPLKPAPSRTARHFIYMHNQKLADPLELYSSDPVLTFSESYVSARYTSRTAQDSARLANVHMPYTIFIEEQMRLFVHQDHEACLDGMVFLLQQYPDDVNALFYSGLCSYNLGLYKRAEGFLSRAASHPVDVFDEEATWYHALTLEKLGENAKAQEEFSRIATAGGFYATKAKERLGQPSGIAH